MKEGLREYVNEGYMLHMLKNFCLSGIMRDNMRACNKKEDYKYKYINSKAKRLLEKKYIVAKVGGMVNIYCFNEGDLEVFCKEYLELTNQ